MLIRLLTQPENECSCGQHCIAMITGRTVDEVAKVVGHRSGTHTKEVVRALEHFGYVCPDKKLKRVKSVVPELCILKMVRKFDNGRVRGHWVVCFNERIYNPWGDDTSLYSKETNLFGWRFTSYLKIIEP